MNNTLVAYRKLIHYNQTKMAKELEISLTSYSQKESGKKNFNQSEMIKITNIIKDFIPDITMDAIFFNQKVSILVTKDTITA
jgi:putative transcriptional regulator